MATFSGSSTAVPWGESVDKTVILDKYQAHLLPILSEMGKYFQSINEILMEKLGNDTSAERMAIQVHTDFTTYYVDGVPVCTGVHVFTGDNIYAWEIQTY